MQEIWKPVPGYEGAYEVSSVGHVRSMERSCFSPNSGGYRTVPMKTLKVDIANIGHYPRVTLFRDGDRKKFKVADLVASAFIGPKPAGYETCHEDGNPSNSSAENLRYDTPRGNQADRKRHGTNRRREPVLSLEQVLEVKNSGLSGLKLAKKFGVSPGAISHIRTGRNWSYIHAAD